MRRPIGPGRGPRTRATLSSIFLLLATAAGASAQNVLSNPELSPDASGWIGGNWGSQDSNGCPSSGSLVLTSYHCAPIIGCSDLGFWKTIAQDCLPVTPGDTVFQQVAYTSEQPVYPFLGFASDAACSVDAGDNSADAPAFSAGGWQIAERTTTVPPSVHSVYAQFVSGGGFATDVDGSIDRAYLGLADRVFSDDFEGGSDCRWSGCEACALNFDCVDVSRPICTAGCCRTN